MLARTRARARVAKRKQHHRQQLPEGRAPVDENESEVDPMPLPRVRSVLPAAGASLNFLDVDLRPTSAGRSSPLRSVVRPVRKSIPLAEPAKTCAPSPGA